MTGCNLTPNSDECDGEHKSEAEWEKLFVYVLVVSAVSDRHPFVNTVNF